MTKHKASAYSKGDFAIYKGEAIIRADTILRTSQPPSVAWNTSKGDTIFIDADSMLEAYTANTAALTDPANISVHPQVFRCEGFPRTLTQADIDTLYKRAIDAEDHLRREVASNQALIATVQHLRGVEGNLDASITTLRNIIDELRAKFIAEKHLADDAVEIIKARDQTIADLQKELQEWKDAALEASEQY